MASREEDVPCGWFLDTPLLNVSARHNNGLDTRLIVHVLHQLVASLVSLLIRPGLMAFLAPVEILHIYQIIAIIIPKIETECDILTILVRG